ncbi:hypothetical protein PV396_24345 [Streptomyces sp. ME02-8801-2C]|uniref:hypothetical protein n=1 Tax=Streptomyces sp. ME02-8801-2C TaxID=3028680 RepID=UPI0029A2BCD6|nr:hypothetical protein [Streptomyces sp. ME02-8801-2C]MDX3455032.1 hypothetical protein [Streptomyces sp. ME02-8801-2C]
MSRPSAMDLAQSAYAAYGEATDHQNYQGQPMPEWEALGERIQKAWIAAAGTIAMDILTSLANNPSPLTPDVGDVVLVPMDPTLNNGAAVAPAIVTRVWNPITINVRVLADSDAVVWRTSVVYRDNLDDVAVPAAVWTWPPRD